MSAAAVTRLVKPAQMRRLSESQTKRHLLISCVGAAISAVAYKMFIVVPMRKAYDHHHLTYDREKEFEIMRQKGLFTSC